MDLYRTWEQMSPSQAVPLRFFLLPVMAVTCVQAIRIARWATRHADSSAESSVDCLSCRITLVARSTRGLARASVWLTCAGGAAGFLSAMIVMGSTGTLPMVILVQQHVEVLEASAISFVLCSVLFAASLAFDLVAARVRGTSPLPPPLDADAGNTGLLAILRSPVVFGAIALVLVSWLLLSLRPPEFAVSPRDRYYFETTMNLLGQLWSRLAIILALVGVLTWVSTLLESATRRRHLATNGKKFL